MKNIKILILLFLGLSLTTGCSDDIPDELTGGAITGGFVSLDAAAIGYVVGNGDTYTAGGSVYQGAVQTTTVNIYNFFTSAATGGVTNEVLIGTVAIADTQVGSTGVFSTSFDYDALIAGLTLDGSPLPADDSALTIGDFWTISFESTLSTGNVVRNAVTTKVSVGTRFAGLYAVVEEDYWRIGVDRDDVSWPTEMLIESVDATTYRCVEYFGAFDGNQYYFQIDENDNITYPDNEPNGDAQTGNGEPLITCQSAPQELSNVPCGDGYNIVVRDDVGGKDRLIMTFGYLTGGTPGNSREFYQVLEKIVD